MRKSIAIILALITITLAIPAFAELQNVTVGGELRLRGNYWDGGMGSDLDALGATHHYNPLFVGPWNLIGRYFNWNNAGQATLRWPQYGAGRVAAFSPRFAWNDDNFSTTFVEERTRLNIRADFTDQVSAFIEFDSSDIWGDDFRSNYLTGADGAAATINDVELYQGYIEANEMFGQPLRVRIGRQEMKFGSGWLVGTEDAMAGPLFQGLSFDAIRATYTLDQLTLDAFWSKLAERAGLEEDGDTDFYGFYASYTGIENLTLDAYYLLVRDAQKQDQTSVGTNGYINEWLEKLASVDQYDPTYLNTIGIRGAGKYGAIDFEAEIAYQFGNADAVGRYSQSPIFGVGNVLYGDDGADFGNWGAHGEVGYAFDYNCHPRIFLGAAYYGGEDNRDVNFNEWLRAAIWPWGRYFSKEASVSFNRLFSDTHYSHFLDAMADVSNLWLVTGGVMAAPTENVKVRLGVSYYQALDTFQTPQYWGVAGTRNGSIFATPFWFTRDNSSDLGWETNLCVVYNYTQDLSFDVGYSHFFTGKGLKEGNYINSNGNEFNGGSKGDDANYFYVQTLVKF